MHKNNGFTLLEMMVALAVLGVVLAIAVPGFQDLQLNSRVSSAAGELVQAINEARGRAISSRRNVLLLQSAGTSDSDVMPVGTPGDWAPGWRIVSGGKVLLRNDRGDQGHAAQNVVVEVSDGGVDVATGDITGSLVEAIGFNNFGQLVDGAGGLLARAAIVICAPENDAERGRVITISANGQVVNNVVNNPDCSS